MVPRLQVPVRGTITIDNGAVRAVKDKKKSLFAAGITKVEGDFHHQVSQQLHVCMMMGASGGADGPERKEGGLYMRRQAAMLGACLSSRHCAPVIAADPLQDAVSLKDEAGVEIGRGLINFSAEELQRLKARRRGGA